MARTPRAIRTEMVAHHKAAETASDAALALDSAGDEPSARVRWRTAEQHSAKAEVLREEYIEATGIDIGTNGDTDPRKELGDSHSFELSAKHVLLAEGIDPTDMTLDAQKATAEKVKAGQAAEAQAQFETDAKQYVGDALGVDASALSMDELADLAEANNDLIDKKTFEDFEFAEYEAIELVAEDGTVTVIDEMAPIKDAMEADVELSIPDHLLEKVKVGDGTEPDAGSGGGPGGPADSPPPEGTETAPPPADATTPPPTGTGTAPPTDTAPPADATTPPPTGTGTAPPTDTAPPADATTPPPTGTGTAPPTDTAPPADATTPPPTGTGTAPPTDTAPPADAAPPPPTGTGTAPPTDTAPPDGVGVSGGGGGEGINVVPVATADIDGQQITIYADADGNLYLEDGTSVNDSDGSIHDAFDETNDESIDSYLNRVFGGSDSDSPPEEGSSTEGTSDQSASSDDTTEGDDSSGDDDTSTDDTDTDDSETDDEDSDDSSTDDTDTDDSSEAEGDEPPPEEDQASPDDPNYSGGGRSVEDLMADRNFQIKWDAARNADIDPDPMKDPQGTMEVEFETYQESGMPGPAPVVDPGEATVPTEEPDPQILMDAIRNQGDIDWGDGGAPPAQPEVAPDAGPHPSVAEDLSFGSGAPNMDPAATAAFSSRRASELELPPAEEEPASFEITEMAMPGDDPSSIASPLFDRDIHDEDFDAGAEDGTEATFDTD